MNTTGIKYEKTGDFSRGRLADYHRKPSPIDRSKTPYAIDTKGIKKQNIISISEHYPYESQFTIGFEVEKNSLYRGTFTTRYGVDREHILFCDIEKDGSCGKEAVTHILPLLPKSKWRNKVLDLFYQSEKILDDRYSPSDYRCGGHITIGVRKPNGENYTGEEIIEKMRKNIGIIYALFRKRLKNMYCGHNVLIGMGEWMNSYDSHRQHHKYQPVLVKEGNVEFRLVSRFSSVKQTIRRYELFYEILDFSFNNPNGSYETLLKRVKPILKSMYEGDMEKVDMILDLSRHFRRFLLTGRINRHIIEFVDRRFNNSDRWDNEVRRLHREISDRLREQNISGDVARMMSDRYYHHYEAETVYPEGRREWVNLDL
mgnify:FL=1